MFFLLFLKIDSHFLIPPVSARTFYPAAELTIVTVTPTNEVNAENTKHNHRQQK